MRKKDLPSGTEISHKDANSKLFVWFLIGDQKVLYGIKRLCLEHGLNVGTFWSRWKGAGYPDVVTKKMISSAGESYKGKSLGWRVDGVLFSSLRSVASFVGRAESTVAERYAELGRRDATFEELNQRKKIVLQKPTKTQLEAQKVLCPDGTRKTIAELSIITGISTRQLRRRANDRNWIFEENDLRRASEIKEEYQQIKMKPVDPIYMTARYAHIKLGDLCHLSSKENTGAGKGEIPDEIWINSRGRQKAFFGSATISFG